MDNMELKLKYVNLYGKIRRQSLTCLTVLLLALWIMPISGFAGSSMDSSGNILTLSSVQIPTTIADVSLFNKRSGYRSDKMDSFVASLVEMKRGSWPDNLPFRISAGRVQLQIVTDAEHIQKAMAAVIHEGGEVTGKSWDKKLVQVWVPVSVIKTLAESEDFFYIRRPTEVLPLEGNSATEAIDVTNADVWHAAGQTGNGVKVAIIDTGFSGYFALKGTDLPAVVTVKNCVDGETVADIDRGDNVHGTACAEIVHDMAPAASLYLIKVLTLIDIQEAVSWAISQGVQVISTSIGTHNATPGDGVGWFADIVNTAYNAGIFWATAAGNARLQHWGGSFSDPDGDGIHNYDAQQNFNFFGPVDGTSAYKINPGISFTVSVGWDDWDVVNQDFDLHIIRFDLDKREWEEFASSENPQTGWPGQTPTELCTVETSGDATVYGFVLNKESATRNVNMEIFIGEPIPSLNKVVHARSLSDLATVSNVVAVAALDVYSPYPQESYSSEGPTNGPGGTATGGAIKPDISAFANVSTESYGNGFLGTSAATPHVAGAAALVLGANPGYTPAQIRSYLESHAVDMGATGKDTVYGYGRLNLGAPSSSIPPNSTVSYIPYLITSDNRWTGISLANYNNSPNDVRIDYYSSNGDFLKSEPKHILAYGQAAFAATTDSGTEGWIKISSELPLKGLALIGDNSPAMMFDIELKNSLHRKLLCPHVAVTSHWNSFVMVCNPNNTAARISLTYFDVSGNLIATIAAPQILANGSAKYSLDDLFQRVLSNGTLVIDSSNPVNAFLLYDSINSTWRAGLSVIPVN